MTVSPDDLALIREALDIAIGPCPYAGTAGHAAFRQSPNKSCRRCDTAEALGRVEQRQQALTEALRMTLCAFEQADSHIRDQLQPEWQRLANGERLSWPEQWSIEMYDLQYAAQRLATWYHGIYTPDPREIARAALEESQ